MHVKVSEIKKWDKYYPRNNFDNKTVEIYRLSLDQLPPITITPDFVLVDGYHRLMAYKLEGKTEIEAEVNDLPEKQILIEAIKCNVAHGKQLEISEKKSLARQLYGELNLGEIAKLLSISERSVRSWTRDQREQEKSERDRKILDMWLKCCTQEEIAEELGIDQATISRFLDDMQNGNASEMHTPIPLKFFDVWNFPSCDKDYGMEYPGRIPGQIVEHILYYYTQPFDIVIDPFCGSGTTVDVCKKILRRYQGYDIAPVRDDIRQHDITNGFPAKVKGCDLIFLDPPYWNMKDNDYAKGSISSLSLVDFREFIKKLALNCFEALKAGGCVAFLIQNQTGNSVPTDMEYIDHAFDSYDYFLSAGFKPIRRISVPLSTETFTPQHVEKAKSEKRLLGLVRDLVIWKK